MSSAGRHPTFFVILTLGLVGALLAPPLGAADPPSPTFCDDDVNVNDPQFSADGSTIWRNDGRSVWAWSEDGGRTEVIGVEAGNFWQVEPAPVGALLAVAEWSGGTGRVVIIDGAHVIDAVDLPAEPTELFWSPDGSSLVVDVSRFHELDVTTGRHLIDVSEGSASLIDEGETVVLGEPHWRPDGSLAVWSSDGTLQYVDPAAAVTPGPGADGFRQLDPRFSPDGTRVAWPGEDETGTAVFVADPDGSDEVRIDDGSDRFAAFLQWSPDGTHLVWYSDALHVATAEGTIVWSDPVDDLVWSVAWSPTSTHLAWSVGEFASVSGAPEATGAVVVRPVDGSPGWSERLREQDAFGWSADGAYLAFGREDNRLVVVTAAGGDEWVHTRAWPVGFEWRPGGSSLAYSSIGSPVLVREATTGDTVDVSAAGSGQNPTSGGLGGWSPSGDRLAWYGRFTASGLGSQVLVSSPDGSDRSFVSSGPANLAFGDVAEGSFAFADVQCISGLGITTGTSDRTYSPADPVTREQMASFVARTWRITGRDCPVGEAPFTDVPESSFAVADVDCLFALGVTTGTTDTTYSPADIVNRAQMASFLARLWRATGGDCPEGEAPFVDVPESSFAAADVDCIFGLGITNGTSPTTYSPGQSVTREQMAAFVARLLRIVTVA